MALIHTMTMETMVALIPRIATKMVAKVASTPMAHSQVMKMPTAKQRAILMAQGPAKERTDWAVNMETTALSVVVVVPSLPLPSLVWLQCPKLLEQRKPSVQKKLR